MADPVALASPRRPPTTPRPPHLASSQPIRRRREGIQRRPPSPPPPARREEMDPVQESSDREMPRRPEEIQRRPPSPAPPARREEMDLAPISVKKSSTDRERPRRRRRLQLTSPEQAPAPALEIDNILLEILHRLPAQPSSLPRVSAVCPAWRRVVSDPHFRSRFLAHHGGKAPLLGFFFRGRTGLKFIAAQRRPDSIRAARFSLELAEGCRVLECRHGRVLILDPLAQRYLVWDPITGDQWQVAAPEFRDRYTFLANGAVVCAARGEGHLHGACHDDPFHVVVLGVNRKGIFACVYSSEGGGMIADNLISISHPADDLVTTVTSFPSTLIGNSLYWVLTGPKVGILEFDPHTQSLAVIEVPSEVCGFNPILDRKWQLFVMAADDGGLWCLISVGLTVTVWKRTLLDGDSTLARWMLHRNIEVGDLRPPKPQIKGILKILGLDEDGNVMCKFMAGRDVYVVHPETMEFKKYPKPIHSGMLHPFASFYTRGMRIGAANGGVEIVDNA